MKNSKTLQTEPLLNASDCLPFNENMDCFGKILVLKPSFLLGEYKQMKYQLVYCTEDNGRYDPLTVEFITDDMVCRDYVKTDFIGMLKPWRMPQWVRERMRDRSQRRRTTIAYALKTAQKEARESTVALLKEIQLVPEDFEITEKIFEHRPHLLIAPLYPLPYDKAAELGDVHMDCYINSYVENAECAAFIEQTEDIFCKGIYMIPNIAKWAVEHYGIDRVRYVLSNTIQHMRDNTEKYKLLPGELCVWADTVAVTEDISDNTDMTKYFAAKCGINHLVKITEQILDRTNKEMED